MSSARFEPSQSDIEVCAYCIWEQEGRPHGRALDHWLQAELQLVVASILRDELTEKRENPRRSAGN